MLVPFVIDLESLTPDQAWSPTTLRACHRQLVDTWGRAGLLVHDGTCYENSSLNRAVKNLAQPYRQWWIDRLTRSPPVPCASDWNGSILPNRIQDLCSIAALALVDDTRAEVEFGFADDEDEKTFTPEESKRVSICRLQTFQHASVIQEAFAISQRNIEAGESYDEIWNSRFRSLASAPIKQIAIVDRYAVVRHFRCRPQWLCGLERFLRLLDKDASEARYVTLYSAWPKGLQTRNINDVKINEVKIEMEALIRKLPEKKVKRLTVHMIPNKAFGNDAHDRYIRFGQYVWELGRGIDIFEGPAAGHLCQASFKPKTESHTDVERKLSDQTNPCAIKILG